MIRLILNGKKADRVDIRNAIVSLREQNHPIEVRVTYEYGDIHRFISEAIADGASRIVIGGGDGSVNEAVDALAKFPKVNRPDLAILPLGTANDFATFCAIPPDVKRALELAVLGDTNEVDMVSANDRFFINIATAGFGAKVTNDTPVELKNFLGGGAYALVGVLKALEFSSYSTRIITPHFKKDIDLIIGAICNGRQAGGGQVLAPNAFINDGLLDVVMVLDFPFISVGQVISEIRNPSSPGEFVNSFQVPWFETDAQSVIPVNLDGEPYRSKKIRFEVVPKAINLVLPPDSPSIKR